MTPRSAFTLLEVTLAIAIATVILGVALFFYKQTEQLRTQLLLETSHVAAARLVLERLALELSTAQPTAPSESGLSGGSGFIQFLRRDWPDPSSWTNTTESALHSPLSPFRLIRYQLLSATNLTETAPATSLTRTEESLVKKKSESEELADETEISPAPAALTVIEPIRFFHLRYCSGSDWLSAWNSPDLPAGIEIRIGFEPLPEGTVAEDYPFEYFQRVIFLPQHRAGPSSTPSLSTPLEEGLF